ncbi:unnamed protein product [Effrenium voratum]|uniref:Uncharacterized protein n=1 Tax=Effrenium voratum TaxID=2562239 RepID=A0AA36JSL4_9DINO|nr:unnamed protein product [Effrenium voratum]
MAGDAAGQLAQGELPIDVAVELERARRLSDRFSRQAHDDGELAREQRARRLSTEFLSTSFGSLLGKANEGIARLEETLEHHRRDQLQALAAQEPLMEASGQPGPGPATPLEKALQKTLEDVSVKSILDIRTCGAGVVLAEATATAALCAVANIDDTVPLSIHSLDPDRPWENALQMLAKPGHVINTLRRFPQAVASKKVPEENMVAARHYLSMAGTGHLPAVSGLQRWITAAIELWEAPPVPKARVEVNFKARDFKPLRSGEVRRPIAGQKLSPRVTVQQKVTGRPLRPVQPATQTQARDSRGAQNGSGDSAARTRSAPRAKSQDQRRQTSPRQPSPRQASPRPAERRQSPRPRPDRPERPAERPAEQPAERPAERAERVRTERERSQRPEQDRARLERTTERPQTRQVERPRPERTERPERDRPDERPERFAERRRQERERSVGTTPRTARTTRPQSALRPGSARLSTDMARSQSRLSPRRPASTSLVGLNSSKSASMLRTPPSATPGSPLSPVADLPSVEELKRMIEETKKEVREIRAVESKTRWQMSREERRDKLAETIASQSELREWRWKQAEGMKSVAVQKAQEAKAVELKESKEFVEFKREIKSRSKEEDLNYHQEVYEDHKKESSWNVEKAQEIFKQEQALVREKVENVVHLREEKRQQVEQQKAEGTQERELQEHLEVAHLAKQLAAEKDRGFWRTCSSAAPVCRRP